MAQFASANVSIVEDFDLEQLARLEFLIALQMRGGGGGGGAIADCAGLNEEQRRGLAKICLLWVIHLPIG